ncbi:MAG: ion channel [Bacteroidota bacterium]
MSEKQPLNVDFGFGSKAGNSAKRLINQDGSFNILRKSDSRIRTNHYQWLVSVTWPQFFGLVLLGYVATNTFFALLYLITGAGFLRGAEGGNLIDQFFDCLFFSVQTFTTVGYGAISPTGVVPNIIASLNALIGLMSVAMVTGLIFARFSRPTADLRFSQKAIIAPYRTGKAFMFRMANTRSTHLIDVSVEVSMTWIVPKGDKMQRHFMNLPLERKFISMMPLNWTIVHEIDKESSLWDKNLKVLKDMNVEFMVLVKAYDEAYGDRVQVHSSYRADEIDWGAKFTDMYYTDREGNTILDLDKIDTTETVEFPGRHQR